MITLTQIGSKILDDSNAKKFMKLICTSADTKPTAVDGIGVANGSELLEADTGKSYLFDEQNQQWCQI